MTGSVETLQYLSASPHRVAVLRTIRDGEEVSRDEIVESVGASQRTVKRALDGFRERGWLVDDGELALSIGGAFVLDSFESFASRVGLVSELEPFFSRIQKEDCHASPEAFADATVVEMESAYPFAAVEYVLEEYREATERVHVLLTYVSIGILEEIASVARGEDIDISIVVDSTVRDAVASNTEYMDRFVEHSSVADVHATDEAFPFSCALIDDTALLTVTNEEGLPTVLLRSSNPAFVAVIEERFQEAREGAVPLRQDAVGDAANAEPDRD